MTAITGDDRQRVTVKIVDDYQVFVTALAHKSNISEALAGKGTHVN